MEMLGFNVSPPQRKPRQRNSTVASIASSGPQTLTKAQKDILEAMSENVKETAFLVELVDASGYSRNTTRSAVTRLRKLGLVHRPHGPRRGDAITKKSLAFLGKG